MGTDYAAGLVEGFFRVNPTPEIPCRGSNWQQQIKDIIKAKPAFTLEPRFYPLLVRFRDINIPESVQIVEPSDLETSFGPGVRLRRITVEVREDEVSEGIEKMLPWLELTGRQRATRLLEDYSPPQLITPNDFSTELQHGALQMNRDVFLALLSMDSYNREGGAWSEPPLSVDPAPCRS